MAKSKLKQVLLYCVAGIGSSLFTSCVVSDGFLGANTGIVGRPLGFPIGAGGFPIGAAGLPVGLVRTSNSNWFYDPYRRNYFDVRRRAYFNTATNRYFTNSPRRFNNRVFPSSWNGRGTFPAPTVSNRGIFTNNRLSNNHPHLQRSNRTTIQRRNNQSQGRTMRDDARRDFNIRSTRSSRSQSNYRQRPNSMTTSAGRSSINSSRSQMSNMSRGSAFGGNRMSRKGTSQSGRGQQR